MNRTERKWTREERGYGRRDLQEIVILLVNPPKREIAKNVSGNKVVSILARKVCEICEEREDAKWENGKKMPELIREKSIW